MPEAKYFRDYQHNYLILQCDTEGQPDAYQQNMLKTQNIAHLLNCSVRYVNGNACCYYDISSKISMRNFFKGRTITGKQAASLFRQLDALFLNLDALFMDAGKLLLSPEYLYLDLSTMEYYGIYFPVSADEEPDNPYEELFDFLIANADMQEEDLADRLYRMYEMSEMQGFSLADAMFLWDEEENPQEAAQFVHAGETGQTTPGGLGRSASIDAGRSMAVDSDMPGEKTFIDRTGSVFSFDDETETDTDATTARSHIKEEQRQGMLYAGLAGAALCLLLVLCYIRMNFILSSGESMVVFAAMGTAVVCGAFFLLRFLRWKKQRPQEQEAEEALLQDISDEFRDERGKQPLTSPLRQTKEDGGTKPSADSETSYGETVFVDTAKPSDTYKLYATDRRNKKHIALDRFPVTIGKMAGCVDYVLPDDSVSRIHARIEREDNRILLTDMNSTNGTFKNGLRIEPGETVEIEPGDELRFGKLNYCCR